MPVYFFYGNDFKQIRKKVYLLEREILSNNPGVETVVFQTPDAKSLFLQFSSNDLFSDKKIAKIYNFEKIPSLEKLFEMDIQDELIFISYLEKKPFKEKKKDGFKFIDCNLPKNYQLEKIIRERLGRYANAEVVFYLSRNITSIVDIEELEERIMEEGISSLDLQALYQIQGDFQAKAFLIVEDIFNKRIQSAIIEMNQFLDSGQAESFFIATLFRQLFQLFKVKKRSLEGFGDDELAKELSVHPFIVKKMRQNSSSFSLKKLENLIIGIPRLEMQIRSHDKKFSRYFLEKFILEVAAK